MTEYYVNWPPFIRDQLLGFLVDAISPSGHEVAAINRALAVIEESLRITPTVASESRAGESRLLVELPLTVEYRVIESQREVLVGRVRYVVRQRS